MNFFLGGIAEEDDTSVSIGLDYEYRLSEIMGVGVFLDYVPGDHRSWTTGFLITWHPIEHLLLVTGVGAEWVDEEGGVERNPIGRVGAGYEFHLAERWTLAPTFMVDFTPRDEIYLLGLTLGLKF